MRWRTLLVYALVVAPQSALSLAGVPALPNLGSLVTLFVTPFVVAGLVGMAAETLDGAADLSTLVDVGRDRHLPLLLGTLVEFGIVVLGGLDLLLVLTVLVVFFLIQFSPVAIAYDGADAVEGFRRSYRLVRDNLIAALGFSLVDLLSGLLTAVPMGALVFGRVLGRGGVDAGPAGPGTLR